MARCEFCQIVGGDHEGHVLYEDDRTIAFLDANPAVEGHTLVLPKDHRAELLDAPDADAVFETVRLVSEQLEAHLEPDGFSVFYTTETLVGTVKHAHVHLLPRTVNDDVSLALERRPLDETFAATLAESVTKEW